MGSAQLCVFFWPWQLPWPSWWNMALCTTKPLPTTKPRTQSLHMTAAAASMMPTTNQMAQNGPRSTSSTTLSIWFSQSTSPQALYAHASPRLWASPCAYLRVQVARSLPATLSQAFASSAELGRTAQILILFIMKLINFLSTTMLSTWNRYGSRRLPCTFRLCAAKFSACSVRSGDALPTWRFRRKVLKMALRKHDYIIFCYN